MNEYVPYHLESRQKAKELTKDSISEIEKYLRIIGYVDHNFVYDYIRAIVIPKRNGLPDVKRCWEKHMGICLDIAAMTVGMLQSVGLNAKLCIGHLGRAYHAWVETDIDGECYIFDHRAHKSAKAYHTEREYT